MDWTRWLLGAHAITVTITGVVFFITICPPRDSQTMISNCARAFLASLLLGAPGLLLMLVTLAIKEADIELPKRIRSGIKDQDSGALSVHEPVVKAVRR